MTACNGRIFHLETMGTVDGPGIRLVLFMQGCPIRCPYCHNPEGWALTGGRTISVDETLSMLRRYAGYYEGGGLTLSGGEPLLQAEFALEVFRRCRIYGIHTALDTSACVWDDRALAACRQADLLLLDIKHADAELCQSVFDFPLENVHAALAARDEISAPVWLRQVILPGLTDTRQYQSLLAKLASKYKSIEKLELLPFRNLCLEKYRQMGIPFPLEQTCPPDEAQIEQLREALRRELQGVTVC